MQEHSAFVFNFIPEAIEITSLAKLTLETNQRLRPDKRGETTKGLFLKRRLIVEGGVKLNTG